MQDFSHPQYDFKRLSSNSIPCPCQKPGSKPALASLAVWAGLGVCIWYGQSKGDISRLDSLPDFQGSCRLGGVYGLDPCFFWHIVASHCGPGGNVLIWIRHKNLWTTWNPGFMCWIITEEFALVSHIKCHFWNNKRWFQIWF